MSSSSSKLCLNSECKNLKPERRRKGWRLRSGELADLCDLCASIYEEGKFCETFHSNLEGWRRCESCGKRVHCGCIVSVNMFTLLDPGGIECIICTRKNMIVGPTPAWSPSWFRHFPPERLNDLAVKARRELAGSGPVPWRQGPSFFGSSTSASDFYPRVTYDVSTGMDRINAGEILPMSSMEKKNIEKFELVAGSLKFGPHETLVNGNAGINSEEQTNSCLNRTQQLPYAKESQSMTDFCFSIPNASTNETNGHIGLSGSHLRPTPPCPLTKQLPASLHSKVESSGDTPNHSGRLQGDTKGRSQLLPRYQPRITDQELQQITVDSNSVITPLFEKMLSASDAGKIGRLVLPKKCAEAHFPPISQPEGLPLQVQDAKGKEWVFQFRFWPNNNSRMYVLEGITPCIQNLKLQAGDIVTFSRLEPEGKLVMGCRKASTAPPSDQDNATMKTGKGLSHGDAELADPNSWSKVDKSGYVAKETLGSKALAPRKRKNSTLGLKSKRLRIETEDLIELKLTWEEAQGLLRPPPNHVPSVVVIEGLEFEEYEEAPILGKPTISASDSSGQRVQWVQCEECRKWRKLPVDVLLPSKWTCSDNSWDPERSLCSAAQELTMKQLEDLLPQVASKKLKAGKEDSENAEALDGLDALANLAIQGESSAPPASSQATTKHPRHRPGCSCIVCIQPPSGKGPKHKQTCTCNVCLTVKRRLNTLVSRREKKHSEKEAATQCQQPPEGSSWHDKSGDGVPSCGDIGNSCPDQQNIDLVNDASDGDARIISLTSSPFKCQIDLNMQPERDEELLPGTDSSNILRMLQHATEIYLRQQTPSSLPEPVGSALYGKPANGDVEKDYSATLSGEPSTPNPTTS